jgi:hypothetical protein
MAGEHAAAGSESGETLAIGDGGKVEYQGTPNPLVFYR